jgi:competence protein ComEA
MKIPVIVAAGAIGLAAIAAYFRAPHASPGATSPQPAFSVAGSSARAEALSPEAVRSAQPGRVVVYVAGEVARPGVYTLPSGTRVDAALRAAGGALPAADPLAVNLAEPLADGERVLVPPRGARAGDYGSVTTGTTGGGPSTGRHAHRPRHRAGDASIGSRHARRHHKAPPASPIDLNAADAQQLQALPGVGPSLAERIVAFREINGPFRSVDELLDVGGMTDRRLDAISAYLAVR